MLGIFLDSETNGLNFSKHQIIDLAYIIIDLNSGEEIGYFHSKIQIPKAEFDLSQKESLEINGFTYEQLIGSPSKEEVRSKVVSHFKKFNIKRGEAVFICQNPSFDRNFFAQLIPVSIQEKEEWPYHWLDLASMYWALEVEHKKAIPPKENRLSKDQIAHYLNIAPEEKPHKAENGARHLLACYTALLGFPQNF